MSTELGHRKLTYDDYALFPEDGKRHEIIDGDHHVSPAPTTRHQEVSSDLNKQLYDQVNEAGRGRVYYAPTDLQLSQNDVVQPDLLVVLSGRNIVTPAKIEGAPDLVVEILSGSTSHRDRGLKLALYERAGVPEYWIVDPVENVLEQHVLKDGRFQLAGRHAESVRSHVVEGVVVDLQAVW